VQTQSLTVVDTTLRRAYASSPTHRPRLEPHDVVAVSGAVTDAFTGVAGSPLVESGCAGRSRYDGRFRRHEQCRDTEHTERDGLAAPRTSTTVVRDGDVAQGGPVRRDILQLTNTAGRIRDTYARQAWANSTRARSTSRDYDTSAYASAR
jgi:hypothetical protein